MFGISYLVIGVGVILSMYPNPFESCPPYVAQFKCSSTAERIGEIISRTDFWFSVLVWPYAFFVGKFLAN